MQVGGAISTAPQKSGQSPANDYIYTWQKMLFDRAESAFCQAGRRTASKVSTQEAKIALLENKLQQKCEDISELMEERQATSSM